MRGEAADGALQFYNSIEQLVRFQHYNVESDRFFDGAKAGKQGKAFLVIVSITPEN